jgi:hypothetical protein
VGIFNHFRVVLGGGALGRSQAAEERAGATAQKQQLEYALKDMDTKVVNDILVSFVTAVV